MESKRITPNNSDDAMRRKRAKRTERYFYARKVLGAKAAAARTACQSVRALVSMFPWHSFPAHLVACGRPWAGR